MIINFIDETLNIEFILNPSKTTLSIGEFYLDTGCKALINGDEVTCSIKENNVDRSQAGIYTVIYTITYQGEEYIYKRYVFIQDGSTPLTLYYDFKRREGDELV